MKEKVWEKRYRAERQKVVGAAHTLEQLQRQISHQKIVIELLTKQVEGLLDKYENNKEGEVGRSEGTPVAQQVSEEGASGQIPEIPSPIFASEEGTTK